MFEFGLLYILFFLCIKTPNSLKYCVYVLNFIRISFIKTDLTIYYETIQKMSFRRILKRNSQTPLLIPLFERKKKPAVQSSL